ncbi:MAG: hypothetical protein AABY10_04440 [Nanoarchaeota archaeon]
MDKLLLKPAMFKPSFNDWEITGVLNPGGIRMQNGKICLYVRVAEKPKQNSSGKLMCPVIVSKDEYKAESDSFNKKEIKIQNGNVLYLKNSICRLTNISHFRKVILEENGFEVSEISDKPNFMGIPGESEYGVEDCRIVKLEGRYCMTYVAVSKDNGVSVALATSKDLTNWERKGIIFQEQNKDAVLFPEKIKGLYVALNRPESQFIFSRPSIWISYSKDLIYWGREKTILRVRENSWGDKRNGAGAPPLKTNKGWLLIYHGVGKLNGKDAYSTGAALLDLKNPEKVIARSPKNKPLFYPKYDYEKKGFYNNVVFPTAAIFTKDKKEILIYSGAADRYVSVRKLKVSEILQHLEYY